MSSDNNLPEIQAPFGSNIFGREVHFQEEEKIEQLPQFSVGYKK
jgi:hypothetical protein